MCAEKIHPFAVKKDPVWEILAYSFLLNVAKDLRQFTTEDLRIIATKRDFRQPDDSRAWGPIILWAKEEGLVKGVGVRKARLPASKSRLVSVWEWTGWA